MTKSLIIDDETHYSIVELQTNLLKKGIRRKINDISKEAIKAGLESIKESSKVL